MDRRLPADRGSGELASITMDGGYTALAFIEKAFAAEHGGYEALDHLFPHDVWSWLGGEIVGTEWTRDFDSDELAALMSHPQRVLAVSTTASKFDARRGIDPALVQKYGAVRSRDAGHDYTLRHVDDEGRVHLRNPWGVQDPKPVPLEHLPAVFPVIHWEAVLEDPPPPSMRTFTIHRR